jgi:hypothetical protein
MDNIKTQMQLRDALTQDMIDGKLPGSQDLVAETLYTLDKRRPSIICTRVLERATPQDIIREAMKAAFEAVDKLERKGERHEAESLSADLYNPDKAVGMMKTYIGQAISTIYTQHPKRENGR